MKRARSYEAELHEQLQDPEEAANYLRSAYEDPDKRVFLLALKDVVEARAGMTKAARIAKVDRRHLYVMLSKNGNPELFNLARLLDAIGIQLTFTTKDQQRMAA